MSVNDAATQNDILNSFFNGLRNKSPEVRLQSAKELQKYVRLISVSYILGHAYLSSFRFKMSLLRGLQRRWEGYGRIYYRGALSLCVAVPQT